jgi:hypothetical protein
MTPDLNKINLCISQSAHQNLKTARKQQIADVAADKTQQFSSESDRPFNNWLINKSVKCKFRKFCESAGFEVLISVTKTSVIIWEYLQKYSPTA